MGVLRNSQKFRVRVWKSYRTHRSSGYCGAGVRTELTEVPSGYSTCCTRTPCIVARVVQNSQKFRAGVQNLQKLRVGIENAVPVPQVFVVLAYGTYRSPGYGYECPAELIEVPGTGETQENTRPRGRILI